MWAFPGMQAARGELQLCGLARRGCRQPINPSLHPVGLVGPKNANQTHPIAPSRAVSLRATHHQRHYLEQQISKAEYTNIQQDLPIDDKYFTNSRHDRLFGH
jgi:hypothetical protein